MRASEMREPTFLILTSLADGQKHGYSLIREASTLSGGRVQLRVGTLYAALDRLQEEGLVRIAGEEVVEGRQRRYFALTDHGADALADETTRLEENARQARERLRRRPALSFPTAAAGELS